MTENSSINLAVILGVGSGAEHTAVACVGAFGTFTDNYKVNIAGVGQG